MATLKTACPTDLELAHHLVDVANEISLPAWKSALPHWTKPDGSPLSAADLEIEDALLHILRRRRPDDAVLAEEHGSHPGTGRRRWLIDPIDGTRHFLAGKRRWGTHVALEIDGVLELAIMSRPSEGLRWWALRGEGAYRSADADPLSRELRLVLPAQSESFRSGGLVPSDSTARTALSAAGEWVTDEVSIVAALLEGRVDAVLDEGGRAWDMAPGALLVREAGGVATDRAGGDRIDTGWMLYCHPLRVPHVMEIVASALETDC